MDLLLRKTPRRARAPLLCIALGAAASPFVSLAATPDEGGISWRACLEEETGWNAPSLAGRLQCGVMRSPIDYDRPSGGDVDVGLIRILAGEPARREGILFFNFGGPGGNPRKFLPAMADWWTGTDANDPDIGDLRRLADRYDLLAIVPRGLQGGRVFDCLADRVGVPFNDLASDRSDSNWRAAEQDAVALVGDCTADRFYASVDTSQHVRDTERVRRLLGDQPLHFYGVSYGTWVGARYGAMFPDRVGRMLFDSSMNVTRDFQNAVRSQVESRHSLFLMDALRPAIAASALYGLGTDETKILWRVRMMPQRAHERWATSMRSAEDLAAALAMTDWLRTDASLDASALSSRVDAHTFSPDVATDGRIRVAAKALIAAYFDDRPSAAVAFLGMDGLSVNQAVLCNDTPWKAGSFFWRSVSLYEAFHLPGGSTSEAHVGLTCSQWPRRLAMPPDMGRLASVPDFLMLQAEHDPQTSLSDARHVLDAYGNARMVLVNGMHGHGVLNPSATPCVLRQAGSYLLNGTLPKAKLTTCESGTTRGAVDQRLRDIDLRLKALSRLD